MLGEGLFIYIMQSVLCWYLKYGIHKHLPHVSPLNIPSKDHHSRGMLQLTFKECQQIFSSV